MTTPLDDYSRRVTDAARSNGKHYVKSKMPSRRRRVVATIVAALIGVAIPVGAAGAYVLSGASNALCKISSGKNCGILDILKEAPKIINPGSNLTPLQTASDGRTNVLVLGTSDGRTDGGGGDYLTDSIMVVSFSQSQKNLYMISVPRDLWVNYGKQCPGGYQGKINALYSCNGAGTGTNPVASDRAALTATIPAFEAVTGLQIQYAVNVNYNVLTDLVNVVGGTIDVNVVSTDKRGVCDVNQNIKAPNGLVAFTAAQALQLARARNDNGGYGLNAGNFDREQNQQAILKGVQLAAEKNGLASNVTGMLSALTGIGDNLRSTFSADELITLAHVVKEIPSTNFHSIDFINATPAIVDYPMINGQSTVAPIAGTFDYSQLIAYIAVQMNPPTSSPSTTSASTSAAPTQSATSSSQVIGTAGPARGCY